MGEDEDAICCHVDRAHIEPRVLPQNVSGRQVVPLQNTGWVSLLAHLARLIQGNQDEVLSLLKVGVEVPRILIEDGGSFPRALLGDVLSRPLIAQEGKATGLLPAELYGYG